MILAEVKADNTQENYKSVPPLSLHEPLEHLFKCVLTAAL